MILLKETAGDTLSGAIDGANTQFTTTFDFVPETVNVYLNGRLKVKDWDDGFWVTGTRLVTMKEPPLLDDTLEIEYRSDTKTGGGALGGVPAAPQTTVLKPDAEPAGENVPNTMAKDLKPCSTSQGQRPTLSSEGELVPVLFRDDG